MLGASLGPSHTRFCPRYLQVLAGPSARRSTHTVCPLNNALRWSAVAHFNLKPMKQYFCLKLQCTPANTWAEEGWGKTRAPLVCHVQLTPECWLPGRSALYRRLNPMTFSVTPRTNSCRRARHSQAAAASVGAELTPPWLENLAEAL